MGLDWLVMSKAKPGHEAEYERLVDAFFAADDDERQELDEQLESIVIAAYETLKPPRVGFDPAADDWVRRTIKPPPGVTDEAFMKSWNGYYVWALLPVNDGLPAYSNHVLGTVEETSFRAQLLQDCESWLGNLLGEAWVYHKSSELLDYADRLARAAELFADKNGVSREVLARRTAPKEEEGPAAQAHIVASAARWCRFWGELGHGMEPWF